MNQDFRDGIKKYFGDIASFKLDVPHCGTADCEAIEYSTVNLNTVAESQRVRNLLAEFSDWEETPEPTTEGGPLKIKVFHKKS